jgi:hypothetical protein
VRRTARAVFWFTGRRAGTVTVRIQLDDCGCGNAPLLIAPGSHRLGRIPTKEAGGDTGRTPGGAGRLCDDRPTRRARSGLEWLGLSQ